VKENSEGAVKFIICPISKQQKKKPETHNASLLVLMTRGISLGGVSFAMFLIDLK